MAWKAENQLGDRILPSQRGYIYFIEHARIEVADHAVEIAKAEGGRSVSYNLPYANSSLVLLGEGTSLTRDAARLLADQGVMVAFTGGGGTPLLSASSEPFVLLEPQSEYRPTEYMQKLAKIFFDDTRRLATAKWLLKKRLQKTAELWAALPEAEDLNPARRLIALRKPFVAEIDAACSVQEVLLAEARHTKQVYAVAAESLLGDEFVRSPGRGEDTANQFLDQGNYLMYGIAGVALHGLGLSFAFAMLHGKTRRGGLVFDVADLLKDGLSIPLAFHHARYESSPQAYRARVIEAIHEQKLIPYLFDTLKQMLEENLECTE